MKKLIAALGLLILVLVLGIGVVLFGIKQNWFGSGSSKEVAKNDKQQETVIEEIEPEESLKEDTVSEEHDEFMDEISSMRSENEEDEAYVPDVVVDTDSGTVSVGSTELTDIVTEADGEQVLKTDALKAAAEGTNLVIPDTGSDTITLDEFAEANGMNTEETEDGCVVLSDTYQTARIVVNSEEPVTDDNAVSIAGPFNDTYVLQYEDEEAAKEACESFADDENVEYAEPEELCFLDPVDSDGVEAYNEAEQDGEALEESIADSVETADEPQTEEESVQETPEESASDESEESQESADAQDEEETEALTTAESSDETQTESESAEEETSADESSETQDGASTAQSRMFSYNSFDTWGSDVVGLKHMKNQVKKTYGSYKNAPVVKVAVIDTGIDYNHPWFKNRLLSKGYDFVNNDKNATDDYMHGTVVAGVIARYTSSNVKILPLKAGDSNGSLSDIDVYNAIEYAIKKKVDVINMSFGRIDRYGSELLKAAIIDARKAGILLVAAYGNDGKNTSHYIPARYKYVIGVSSVNMCKTLSSFSNYGKYVDITAPGECIYTAYPTYMSAYEPYAYMDGTSLSAPFVSAACAMVKSIYPNAKASRIRKIMYSNARQLGSQQYFGNGLLYLKKFTSPALKKTETPSTEETTAAESTSAESVQDNTAENTVENAA